MFRRTSLTTALTLAAALSVPGFALTANAAPPRVLVIPFTTLNIADNQQWIGRAVQENIIADLGHSNTYSPVAFQGQLVVEDNATAVSLAHKAAADFVVRGAAQQVEQNIRLTAQMIDARSGDTLTTASVTGPTSDLLKLEDQLSAQLNANAASAQQAAAQTPPAEVSGPATVDGASSAGPITYTPNPVYTTPLYTPSYTPGYSYVPYETPVYSGYSAGYSYPYSYGFSAPFIYFGGSYYHGSYGHGGWDRGGGWNHGGGGSWGHGGNVGGGFGGGGHGPVGGGIGGGHGPVNGGTGGSGHGPVNGGIGSGFGGAGHGGGFGGSNFSGGHR